MRDVMPSKLSSVDRYFLRFSYNTKWKLTFFWMLIVCFYYLISNSLLRYDRWSQSLAQQEGIYLESPLISLINDLTTLQFQDDSQKEMSILHIDASFAEAAKHLHKHTFFEHPLDEIIEHLEEINKEYKQ